MVFYYYKKYLSLSIAIDSELVNRIKYWVKMFLSMNSWFYLKINLDIQFSFLLIELGRDLKSTAYVHNKYMISFIFSL